MKNDIIDLMEEFLSNSYPITRVRLPNGNKPKSIKTNFKRAIKINSNIVFKISDTDQRYKAMHALSNILCRVFQVSQDDTIPIIKKHLHIK
jgi:hypothetical protein